MEWEQQRCKYEVLGLRNDCTAEEVRSAFKELVRQRHPDKLAKPYQCGRRISYVEAAALFQELLSAYDVLSHPKDRARYDSFRRSRILSDGYNNNSSAWNVPDLSLYLSTSAFDDSCSDRGFYKVYSDLFDKVYANELKFATKLGLLRLKEAAAAAPPRMGNLDSSNNKVAAFYRYWSRFSTVIDYGWVNQYDCKVNWNYAKYEYSMTVRKLVRFVLKMDKRVIYLNVRKMPLETRRAIVASANLGKKRTKLIWTVIEEEEEYLEYWRYLNWTIIDQRQHEESRGGGGGGGGGGLDERNNNNNNNRRLMLRFDEEERPQELLLCRLKLMRIPYVSSIIYILLLITSITYCCFFKF